MRRAAHIFTLLAVAAPLAAAGQSLCPNPVVYRLHAASTGYSQTPGSGTCSNGASGCLTAAEVDENWVNVEDLICKGQLHVEDLTSACAEDETFSVDGAGHVVCSAGSSGSAVALDLGNNGSEESTALTKLVTASDTNSIFSEPSSDVFMIDVSKAWPLSDAATALSSNPTDCSAGQYANAIAASGNLSCGQVAASELSGSVTDAQVPNTITIDLASAATALAANGGNCSSGKYPLGVDASGATESCTNPFNASTATDAGTAFALTATAPAQTTTSQAGPGVTVTASDAVAGSSVAGAAAGGAETHTTGAAKRLTSGDANGGDFTINLGAGIGAGAAGNFVVNGGRIAFGTTGGALVSQTNGMALRENAASGNGGTLTLSTIQISGYMVDNANIAAFDGSGVRLGDGSAIQFKSGQYNGTTVGRDRALRNTTSNGTQTELFLNGSSTRMTMSNDSTWMFSCRIAARRTDADNESAGYTVDGVIDRNTNAASTALVGSITKTVQAEDTAAWDVDAQADSTNGALVIKVTGEAAKTIQWIAVCRTVEATG